ncbi:MAG: alpha-galactosidase [Lachnospiraceae bacterium]|nr:alpha-galactosidase [Lachnospiraceae bacterium]
MTEQEIKEEIQRVIERGPREIKPEYRFDAFKNGEPVLSKKKGHLPAMGWNSWNAFGSGNTEMLTKEMADAIVRLDLDKLGYRYVVLDDGCYKNERVDGHLSNEEVKFPSGFKALASYIHDRGLKFGMYNDIGTNLCAGAYVGTCGHEAVDARSYIDWDVDFLKVDNCYYLWDNATFSDGRNARYVYAPNIRAITLSGEGYAESFSAVEKGILRGERVSKHEGFVTDIGTFDGTGPGPSPIGNRSGELVFYVNVPKSGSYTLSIEYATSAEEGQGSWLQVAVGKKLVYDNFVPETAMKTTYGTFDGITLPLCEGENEIRLMNHRRQENTLCSYATLLEELNRAKPGHDILLSICEWGKTQPQNWGYKVGDSWRILNDITFRVGSDGNAGFGAWKDGYTPSVTSQYNKAVIMDSFAGLDKGWNDPDMLMIGMDGLTDNMYRTHMAMWCMMNSPLMLGLDLRRVTKGDKLYRIIANEQLIALNQDPLGVQAKRIYCSIPGEYAPDTTYITNLDRVDILAKPLADGSVALSFINLREEESVGEYAVTVERILAAIGEKLPNLTEWKNAKRYRVTDLWSGEVCDEQSGTFAVKCLAACDNVTVRVTPNV